MNKQGLNIPHYFALADNNLILFCGMFSRHEDWDKQGASQHGVTWRILPSVRNISAHTTRGGGDSSNIKRSNRALGKKRHKIPLPECESGPSETRGILDSIQVTDEHVGQSHDLHDRLDQSGSRTESCDQGEEVMSSWGAQSWSCDQIPPWSIIGKHTEEGMSVEEQTHSTRPGTLAHPANLRTPANLALFDAHSASILDSLTGKWFPPS